MQEVEFQLSLRFFRCAKLKQKLYRDYGCSERPWKVPDPSYHSLLLRSSTLAARHPARGGGFSTGRNLHHAARAGLPAALSVRTLHRLGHGLGIPRRLPAEQEEEATDHQRVSEAGQQKADAQETEESEELGQPRAFLVAQLREQLQTLVSWKHLRKPLRRHQRDDSSRTTRAQKEPSPGGPQNQQPAPKDSHAYSQGGGSDEPSSGQR